MPEGGRGGREEGGREGGREEERDEGWRWREEGEGGREEGREEVRDEGWRWREEEGGREGCGTGGREGLPLTLSPTALETQIWLWSSQAACRPCLPLTE